MQEKLTHTLPQIRCSEKTRNMFEKMCNKKRRSLSNILQIVTEDVALHFEETGSLFTHQKKENQL